MTKLSNGKLRYLIELSGAGAILVGLIFVGLELRQNTAAMQAVTIQGLADSSQDYLLLIASNPDLVEIQKKATMNPDQLSETEARQYFMLERTRWLRSHVAFQQFSRGTLGEADWENYERLICRRKRSSWQDHKSVFSNQFVEFVESTCKWQNTTP